MKTKHARAIREGIFDRLTYNDMYRLGWPSELLQWWINICTKHVPKHQREAFMRTCFEDGKVYTGNKWGAPFVNPAMRRRGQIL